MRTPKHAEVRHGVESGGRFTCLESQPPSSAGTAGPRHIAALSNRNVRQLLQTAKKLLNAGGLLQSTTSSELIGEQLVRTALEHHLAIAERNRPTDGPPPSAHIQVAASEILRNASNALTKTAETDSPASLTDAEVNGLQAIIQVIGRPALRFTDGRVQMPLTNLGENEFWSVFVAVAQKNINRASASVARLVLERQGDNDQLIGTGWRLGENLLVTNRHVARLLTGLEPLAASRPLQPSPQAVADFSATDNVRNRVRMAIVEIPYCAENGDIDIAVIRVAPQDVALPPALELDLQPESLGHAETSANGDARYQGERVYVVGHPYRPDPTAEVRDVFGDADGRKRCSPGFVTRLHTSSPILEHDCSTLGGNSGSCVLTQSLHRVVGLHFGGDEVDPRTGIGRANLAVALCRLPGHKVESLLRTGRIPEYLRV